jgi:hypothetical protein
MDRQTNIHDEEQSGLPSAVSDSLVQSVDQNICERQRFTISEFHVNFRKFHTVRLGYRKFYIRWVPKMLMGVHRTQRMASSFVDCFIAIPQIWR